MVKSQSLNSSGPPLWPHDLKVTGRRQGCSGHKSILQSSPSIPSCSGLVPLWFGLSDANPLFPIKQNHHLISIPRMFCDCRKKESCDCQSKHGGLGDFQKHCWLH